MYAYVVCEWQALNSELKLNRLDSMEDRPVAILAGMHVVAAALGGTMLGIAIASIPVISGWWVL